MRRKKKMTKPKCKFCRYCKWLVQYKNNTGFCDATYKMKTINSRGEHCQDYEYDPNDTFYKKGWKTIK